MNARTPSDRQSRLRALPSVSEVDQHLAERGLPSGKAVRGQVTAVLEHYRAALMKEPALPAPPRAEVLRAIDELPVLAVAATH